MEKYNILLTLIICCCLTACQWNLEEIDLANAQATCLQKCVNGTCNSNNICECKTDWKGLNCDEEIENPTTNLNFCDTVNCNNGTCNEALDRCDCEYGWMGEDCLIPVENEVVTFEKTISFGQDSIKIYDLIKTKDEGYLINSTKFNSLNNSFSYYFFRLDRLANKTWQFSHNSYTQRSSNSLELSTGYLIGTSLGSLFKLNFSGSSLNNTSISGTKSIASMLLHENRKIISLGSTRSSNSEFWIAGISETCEVLWENTFGGSKSDFLTDAILLDNNIFSVGNTSSNNGDVQANYGDYDICLVKTDLLGNLNWIKNFGGSSFEYANTISLHNNNSFLFGGYTASSNIDVSKYYGGIDFWLINADKDGNLLWEKTYGGSGSDIMISIKPLTDNNYILAGHTKSSDLDVNFNNGGSDFWLIKIDPSGNIIWEKTYGTSGDEILSDMQVTSDGGFIMVGTKDDKDIYIVKTDANGNL